MRPLSSSIQCGVAALIIVSACTTSPLQYKGAEELLSDARGGAVDVCAAEQIGLLGMPETTLVALRQELSAQIAPRRDPWARSIEIQRMVGLQDTLTALNAAEDGAQWLSARQAAQAQLADWRRQSNAVGRRSEHAVYEQLAIWTAARRQIEALWLARDELQAGTLDCLHAPYLRSGKIAFGEILISQVQRADWPDNRAYEASTSIWFSQLERSFFSTESGEQFCANLTNRSDEATVRRGAFALLGRSLQCESDTVTADEYVAAFEQDWVAVGAFLDTLPSTSVGDDLRLRVELEQFGRKASEIFSLRFSEAERTQILRDRLWRPIAAADRANTAQVQDLLRSRDWFDDAIDGEGSQRSAWLIIQHSDASPAFQREMLDRLPPYVGMGRVAPSEYAMLWDRVAVHEGKPQRFGTQLGCQDGELNAKGGLEEADHLDARRAEVGLMPWATYRAMMRSITRACPRADLSSE